MYRRIICLIFVLLLIGLNAGCSTKTIPKNPGPHDTPETLVPTSDPSPVIDEGDEEGGEFSEENPYNPESTDEAEEYVSEEAASEEFQSLSEFLEVLNSQKKNNGIAELGKLEHFFMPDAIPEDYLLYRIGATRIVVSAKYYPPECLDDRHAYFTADTYQNYFVFAHYYKDIVFEKVLKQYGASKEDLLYGKYLICGDFYNEIIWEEQGDVMMLKFPRDIEVEQIDESEIPKLCSIVEYVRTEDGTFKLIDSKNP